MSILSSYLHYFCGKIYFICWPQYHALLGHVFSFFFDLQDQTQSMQFKHLFQEVLNSIIFSTYSGGLMLRITGTNLDTIQKPRMYLTYFSPNGTTKLIQVKAPKLDFQLVSYTNVLFYT